jgi:hypothetical protein
MGGKNTTHKPAFTCYCELALKSAGMWITRGGGGGGPPVPKNAKEVALRGAGGGLSVAQWRRLAARLNALQAQANS